MKKEYRKTLLRRQTLTKSLTFFQSKIGAFYNFRETYSYSFVGINISTNPIELSIDGNDSKDMLHVPSSGRVTKTI